MPTLNRHPNCDLKAEQQKIHDFIVISHDQHMDTAFARIVIAISNLRHDFACLTGLYTFQSSFKCQKNNCKILYTCTCITCMYLTAVFILPGARFIKTYI